jgi:hypothetical protein
MLGFGPVFNDSRPALKGWIMRKSAILAAAAVLSGCNNPLAVQCVMNSNCNLTSGGFCAKSPTGNQWCAYGDPSCPSGLRYAQDDVGEGLAGSCVAAGVDAGTDAADGMPDAMAVDPRPGEADLVLGQETFTSMEPNHGGTGDLITARSLYLPTGIAFNEASGSIWVADGANTRILGWQPAPIANFTAASVVVGQQTFESRDGGFSISRFTTLDAYVGIATGGDKLLIPNGHSHRVLIFNPIPTSNLPNASLVLGQNDFISSKTGNGASDFATPVAAWTDGTRIAVADVFNNRVLIWTSFPTTNGQAASLVLGQQRFGTGELPAIPSASSLNRPTGVYSDGTRFYVSDTANHRVLIWNSFPTSNGQPADIVLGQASFTTNAAGTSNTGFREPAGIATAGNMLFIADTLNNRVVVFSPIPITSGTAAEFVIGQPDFNASTAGTTRSSMSKPRYLAIRGRELYVSDTDNNRVIRVALQF